MKSQKGQPFIKYLLIAKPNIILHRKKLSAYITYVCQSVEFLLMKLRPAFLGGRVLPQIDKLPVHSVLISTNFLLYDIITSFNLQKSLFQTLFFSSSHRIKVSQVRDNFWAKYKTPNTKTATQFDSRFFSPLFQACPLPSFPTFFLFLKSLLVYSYCWPPREKDTLKNGNSWSTLQALDYHIRGKENV